MVRVFDYNCYKSYMLDHIASLPKGGHGERRRLAEAISSQTTYISQVLKGDNHFSLEQAEQISRHWGHSEHESHFFFLLIQLARAGTSHLGEYFQKQISEIKNSRKLVSQRVGNPESLSEREQHIYYSCWHYAAIHVLVSIPGFGTKEAIAKHLNLSLSTVSEVLEFLLQYKLIDFKNNQYCPGTQHIHLPARSIQIRRHHTNWRNQAMISIDKNLKEDLHYSVVATLSKKDVELVREKILILIEETMATIKETNPEQAQALTVDFFSLSSD